MPARQHRMPAPQRDGAVRLVKLVRQVGALLDDSATRPQTDHHEPEFLHSEMTVHTRPTTTAPTARTRTALNPARQIGDTSEKLASDTDTGRMSAARYRSSRGCRATHGSWWPSGALQQQSQQRCSHRQKRTHHETTSRNPSCRHR